LISIQKKPKQRGGEGKKGKEEGGRPLVFHGLRFGGGVKSREKGKKRGERGFIAIVPIGGRQVNKGKGEKGGEREEERDTHA